MMFEAFGFTHRSGCLDSSVHCRKLSQLPSGQEPAFSEIFFLRNLSFENSGSDHLSAGTQHDVKATKTRPCTVSIQSCSIHPLEFHFPLS